MDISKQLRTTIGLISCWEDIYIVQGKSFIAARLKPGIEKALWRVGPLFLSLAEGFEEYFNYSVEQRRMLISQALKQKPGQLQAAFLKRWLYYTAKGCNGLERTEAEMEKLYVSYVQSAMPRLTLKELLETGLRLSTSSIAGADKRLKIILDKRFSEFAGDMRVYEQDLKYTLWELIAPSLHSLQSGLSSQEVKENSHANNAFTKFVEGQPQRTPEEQVSLLLRIYKNQEPELARTIQLSVIREMIADLPDIHQEVKQLATRYPELPLPENAAELELEAIWKQPIELSEEDSKEAIKEFLASKGIDSNFLTPREWAEMFERLDLIRKGYEFSSKSGISISSYYGKDADKKKKRWSRIKQKIEKRKPEI